jgi:hypothetical protein
VIKLRRLGWGGHVALIEKLQKLVGKPDGMKPLGRSRLRWEDTIKMDLKETGM